MELAVGFTIALVIFSSVYCMIYQKMSYKKLDSIDSRIRDEAIYRRQHDADRAIKKWDMARYQTEVQYETERYTR